ncbi:P protein [Orchesella cincta]|uniref:P protein n=1 Tax=Orchesella cincta TaxID=48709 RepID=A0A1D2NFG2_ORCCI|nr:P protein [Orchesella cincta]
MHSIPELNLSMGWTALLGAVLLLILADRKELEGIFSRVEWSTLIFFSALFIVMESVSKLGLLDWIGNQTEEVILHVNPESRTIVAILIILWVSGIASAFIDNIPFTTMMIQIVTKLATSLQLPLNPLVWALAFGTCLGGNGTLIGASANVVCAGVADQHGYRFSFVDYFRIGFPMMIVSLVVASAYLVTSYYIGFY